MPILPHSDTYNLYNEQPWYFATRSMILLIFEFCSSLHKDCIDPIYPLDLSDTGTPSNLFFTCSKEC